MRTPVLRSVTRSGVVARGSASLMLAQVVVGAVQIVYSGIASRLLAPAAFGLFAVSMAALGLLSLVLASGLPSAALALERLTGDRVSALTLLSVAASAAAALLLVLLAPAWTHLWSAGDGATGLLRLLAVYALLAGPAALQQALLRREGRTQADASLQVVVAIMGAVVGVVAVAQFRTPSALLVSPTVTAAAGVVLPALFRRRRYGLSIPHGWQEVGRFSFMVSFQNLVFWVMVTAPTWAVSVATDERILGQYSRAAILTAMPSMALAAALTRALQPHYRALDGAAGIRSALGDVLVILGALTVTAFGLLVVLADETVQVWLGPGWSETAEFLRPLAVGYGLCVAFTVLANAAEMLSFFREVRRTQVVMLLAGAPLIALAIHTGRAAYAAWTLVAIMSTGLVALTLGLGRRDRLDVRRVLVRVGPQTLLIGALLVLARLASSAIVGPFTDLTGTVRAATVVVATVTLFGALGAVTFRRSAAWTVVRERGLL